MLQTLTGSMHNKQANRETNKQTPTQLCKAINYIWVDAKDR